MKRSLFGLAAIATLVAAPAFAADMPLKAPPPPPAWNWSGFYLGVDGGYGWSPYSNQLEDLSNAGFPFLGLSPKGGFGGGEIGYNWQPMGTPFVLGVEADIQDSGIKASQTWGLATSTSSLTWFDTVRGRVGFAFGHALLYGTAGWAEGHINNSEIGGTAYTISKTSSGSAVGGGVEYAFSPHLSAKVEYQYIRLGTNIPQSSTGVLLTAFPGVVVHPDAFNTVRVGVNYRFNLFAPGP